jgi:hypothetical protein
VSGQELGLPSRISKFASLSSELEATRVIRDTALGPIQLQAEAAGRYCQVKQNPSVVWAEFDEAETRDQ